MRIVQPAAEIALRHPAPPADLQPLVQIELVDLEPDPECGKDAEVTDLVGEYGLVALLQRIVEDIVPAVEQNGQKDHRELDGDYRGQQAAAGPFVLRVKI